MVEGRGEAGAPKDDLGTLPEAFIDISYMTVGMFEVPIGGIESHVGVY